MFQQLVADATFEAPALGTIVVGELQQGLALGRIGRADTRLLPSADDGVVLGGELCEQVQGLVFVVLLSMVDTVDEEQRHPGVDDQQVGLHAADMLGRSLGVDDALTFPFLLHGSLAAVYIPFYKK